MGSNETEELRVRPGRKLQPVCTAVCHSNPRRLLSRVLVRLGAVHGGGVCRGGVRRGGVQHAVVRHVREARDVGVQGVEDDIRAGELDTSREVLCNNCHWQMRGL